MSKNIRADLSLIKHGLADSREKAKALIIAGCVYRNEVKIEKTSELIDEDFVLTVRGKPHPYVSRGALKLEKALKSFNLEVKDIVAMDIGASTGGFTDVLLQNGAKHVYAIDVGYGQFDWKLRNDERVTLYERTNARYLKEDLFTNKPSLSVMDVSFISIKLIIRTLFEIMGDSGILIALIKPQFEAGANKIGKHGVVKELSTHIEVVNGIIEFLNENDFMMTKFDYSPIKGPKGNIEYICEIRSNIKENILPIDKERIISIIEESHNILNKNNEENN